MLLRGLWHPQTDQGHVAEALLDLAQVERVVFNSDTHVLMHACLCIAHAHMHADLCLEHTHMHADLCVAQVERVVLNRAMGFAQVCMCVCACMHVCTCAWS